MKIRDQFGLKARLILVITTLLSISCERMDTSMVTDIDGNTYSTVKIGHQVWMGENLRVTRFRNGDPIATTIPGTKDITGEINPSYYWYPYNNVTLADTFGLIYTWNAANDYRKICPAGWHLPSGYEWETLADRLGGIDYAGGKMKETGTIHWASPNSGATNESGFSAIPGGYRNPNGFFFAYPRRYDVWWSTSATSDTKAYHYGVGYSYFYLYKCEELKSQAVSIRCIRD